MDSYRKIQNRYRAIRLDKEGYMITNKMQFMSIFGVDIEEIVSLSI